MKHLGGRGGVSLLCFAPNIEAKERILMSKDQADRTDRALGVWRERWSEGDVSGLAVVLRLEGLAELAGGELAEALAAAGVSRASFDVLLALRLADGEELSQRALVRRVGRTPGTMSVRLGRLAERGLVTRAPSGPERRGRRVALTVEGRALVDDLAPGFAGTAARLLAGLTDDEREQLAMLLRRLALELEGPADGGARLGIAVAPAHVAQRMRRAVGLTERVGVLVRGVARGGPGAVAGLDEGDLIVSVAGQEVRTVGDLQRAVANADRVTLGVVRGIDERQVEVAPAAS
jgi:DNA-binding MarR family transcriptional regulator